MTATITTRPLSDSSDSLLRFAMRADATLCAGLGLLVALAADPLSRLSGLSATSEWVGRRGARALRRRALRARRPRPPSAGSASASSSRTWCSPSPPWRS